MPFRVRKASGRAGIENQTGDGLHRLWSVGIHEIKRVRGGEGNAGQNLVAFVVNIDVAVHIEDECVGRGSS